MFYVTVNQPEQTYENTITIQDRAKQWIKHVKLGAADRLAKITIDINIYVPVVAAKREFSKQNEDGSTWHRVEIDHTMRHNFISKISIGEQNNIEEYDFEEELGDILNTVNDEKFQEISLKLTAFNTHKLVFSKYFISIYPSEEKSLKQILMRDDQQ